ncbi:MAG TPA: hypothetical protein VH374_24730 [Polyangia bacterium]|nr:hypothetical protein [Polyangia bacterium]
MVAPRSILGALLLASISGAPPNAPRLSSPAPSLVPPPAPVDTSDEHRQRGVALGLFAEDVGFSYSPLLAEIVALGATHVALIVPVYQTDARSDDLHLHTRFSPTLEVVADTIRAALRDRLEVSVFPIIRLSAPRPGEWRGTLAPADPERWFRRYTDVLGDLAAVAAVTGAQRLVIGSELSSLDGDVARWRPLVERMRGLFKGTLVYSANWDHYRQARLFDLVDEEGITGYFNLRGAADGPADDAALEATWRRIKSELSAWRAERKTAAVAAGTATAGASSSFVFTELGYRSRAGATAAPWDEAPGGIADADEQRRAFAAFRRVWSGTPFLDGVYIWNWYGYGGPGSRSYTPRGKPAEVEVKALLKQL